MTTREKILGAFGVRTDEAGRVTWLVAHSLFIGIFSAFFLTAANALFLDRFEISYLPLAYIAAAVLGYVALMLFSRLEKAVSIQTLLLTNLGVLLLVTGGLWAATLSTGNQWVVFFMFAWVGPAFGLVSLGYWALASRLFDLRQGKRLFGLVGAGEEVTTVASLFSVPLILKWVDGPVGLLPLAALGLVGCLVVVLAITRRMGATLEAAEDQRSSGEQKKRVGLRDLLKQRYFLLMAGLIILLSLGNYIVDFGFLAEVRGRFEGGSQIAQFIGVFFGVTKILELVMKAFLSGRLLNQFGLKFGLMLLPALLAVVAGLAIVIGSLGLSGAHFFVLIALSKLVWVVNRTSMFEPTFRVLYQPVPAVDRLAFQTHVEGTAKQLATGVVGVGLLLFSQGGTFNALYLFYALVPILAVWMVVNVLAHRDYRARLMESLNLRKRQQEIQTPLDVLRTELHSPVSSDREIGLDLLEKLDEQALEPALKEMLSDPHPGVRTSALRHVEQARRVDLSEAVQGTEDDPDPAFRAAAKETLDRLREVGDLSADGERVEVLAGSTEPEKRALAATALGRGSREHSAALTSLLFDRDWTVRRRALEAAGRLGRDDVLPQIVADLTTPAFAPTAATALVRMGEPSLVELEKAFNKPNLPPSVRQRILEIYEHIGGDAASSLLLGKLAFPDRTVRQRALLALSRSGFQAKVDQVGGVERVIERVVGNTAWNMSAVLDLGADDDLAPVREALEEEIDEGRSRLYLLLSLLYDPAAINLVRENIESGSSEATVYALEILDLLISDELKPLVFPLLEDLPYPQVLRRLDASHPRQRLEPLDRLSVIVNRDFDRIGTWTRACAVEALGALAPTVPADLVACLFHPNPLIHEVAARAILDKDPGEYQRRRRTLPYEVRERLDHVIGAEGTLDYWDSRSVFGRARLLRGLAPFQGLPLDELVELSASSEERVLKPHRRLPSPRAPGDTVYVVVDGEVAVAPNGSSQGGRRVPPLTVFGFGPGARALSVVETARFVRLDPDELVEVASGHVEVIPAYLQALKLLIDEGSVPGDSSGELEAAPAEVEAAS